MVKTNTVYRHFKGNQYLVLHIAKHSETMEITVVYKALYGEQGVWVRPLEMFEEKVVHEGKIVKRFSEININI